MNAGMEWPYSITLDWDTERRIGAWKCVADGWADGRVSVWVGVGWMDAREDGWDTVWTIRKGI